MIYCLNRRLFHPSLSAGLQIRRGEDEAKTVELLRAEASVAGMVRQQRPVLAGNAGTAQSWVNFIFILLVIDYVNIKS